MKSSFFVIIIVSIAFFMVCIFSSGCQGHCIKIDGGYKDLHGGLTWCLDKEMSNEVQNPILVTKDNNTGAVVDTAVVLSESADMDTILRILQEHIVSIEHDVSLKAYKEEHRPAVRFWLLMKEWERIKSKLVSNAVKFSK